MQTSMPKITNIVLQTTPDRASLPINDLADLAGLQWHKLCGDIILADTLHRDRLWSIVHSKNSSYRVKWHLIFKNLSSIHHGSSCMALAFSSTSPKNHNLPNMTDQCSLVPIYQAQKSKAKPPKPNLGPPFHISEQTTLARLPLIAVNSLNWDGAVPYSSDSSSCRLLSGSSPIWSD
jgi:hypothetical protein